MRERKYLYFRRSGIHAYLSFFIVVAVDFLLLIISFAAGEVESDQKAFTFRSHRPVGAASIRPGIFSFKYLILNKAGSTDLNAALSTNGLLMKKIYVRNIITGGPDRMNPEISNRFRLEVDSRLRCLC